ncbi:MAG: hypothetical protein A2Y79_08475 [Deltaproteobacteria bacterium RBG_13_43_22]|nr:MAG: hypothetical protein A2Y79_08475 [Deltaproteobacteria bacterium RBG_13_43_22]
MANLTPEEEARKKAIFDSMSPKLQQRILKKGYEVWDPFMEPNDPIDLRKGKLNRTALDLTRAFLAACDFSNYSNAFGQGAWEICKGLIDEDDRYIGMYAFSLWYEKESVKAGTK